MPDRRHILLVDDEDSFRMHLARLFMRKGYDVTDVRTGEEALKAVSEDYFDVVLLDIVLPDIDGVEVLRRIRSENPNLQVIMMTGNATVQNAIASMKLGAYDYLTKPFDLEELSILIERACEISALRREHQLMRRELDRHLQFTEFIARDDKTLAVLKLVDKVAPTDSTVLITGETGTGKELIARAIHEKSPRRGKPWIVINCSAIPEALLESEMFGYEKGAFTGAIKDKSGLIEMANTGTLFLDEVGDLPPSLQIKLLRVLETGEYRPVGSTRTLRANVRIIAATNRDLRRLMREGKFREDLYYRLNVIHIHVPPLRERPKDIPVLVDYFMKKTCARVGKCVRKIEPKALQRLYHYHWPGNVRELENVIERAIILATGDTISIADLPLDLWQYQEQAVSVDENDKSLAAVEKEHILRILRETGGNKAQAARILGITKKTLYAKLRKYGMFAPEESG